MKFFTKLNFRHNLTLFVLFSILSLTVFTAFIKVETNGVFHTVISIVLGTLLKSFADLSSRYARGYPKEQSPPITIILLICTISLLTLSCVSRKAINIKPIEKIDSLRGQLPMSRFEARQLRLETRLEAKNTRVFIRETEKTSREDKKFDFRNTREILKFHIDSTKAANKQETKKFSFKKDSLSKVLKTQIKKTRVENRGTSTFRLILYVVLAVCVAGIVLYFFRK